MNIENILAPYGAVPTEIQYEWLNRKTAFIHFTVNTFTGKIKYDEFVVDYVRVFDLVK